VTRRPSPRVLAAAVALGLLAASCSTAGSPAASGAAPSPAPTAARPAGATNGAVIDPGDGGRYAPVIDPARFVDGVDNPYLPLRPGSSWVYEGTVDGERQRVEVTVRPERRQIMGIPAVSVRDEVFGADGTPAEVTTDWFAQDRDGNVWYLGEDTREVDHGKVTSTKGSWVAGVDGALPGIVMPATPVAGRAYRQEFYRGEAEDMAQVLRVGATGHVRAGSYDRLVVTREWTPLEPKNVEEKSYAPGVGNVLIVSTAGEHGRVELTRFTPGSG